MSENASSSSSHPPGSTPHLSLVRLGDLSPCLAVHLVHSMFDVQPLPGELPEAEMLALTRQQVARNRLRALLVLDESRTLAVGLDGSVTSYGRPPSLAILSPGKLRTAGGVEDLPEVRERLRLFEADLRRRNCAHFVFGDLYKGGHEATAEEIARLAGVQDGGVPLGLSRCPGCMEWRGECLDPNPRLPWLVVPVHCRCENHNLCAACGEPLYERRLNGNYYNEQTNTVWHVPGFSGLAHHCSDRW